MTQYRLLKSTRVQVARAWSASNAGWTTLEGTWAEEGSEGAGQVVGEMTLRQVFGVTLQPGDDAVYNWGVAPDYRGSSETTELTDQYVRVLIEDTAGTVQIGKLKFRPFWWGIVGARILDPDGASDYPGGSAQWSCLGITALLDRIFITRGYEVAPDGVSVVDPGFCPVFNDLPFGDSSDAPFPVNGSFAFIFNRGEAGAKERWLAADVIDYLLRGYGNYTADGVTFAGGLTWALGTGGTLLDFDAGRIDPLGRTLLSILNDLVNPRRGLIWKERIDGSIAYIDIFSTSEETVSVGSATIPAASQVDVTITDDVFKSGVTIAQDPSAYDVLHLMGGQPLVAMTLGFRANQSTSEWALIPDDWTPGETPSEDPTEAKIWRRWRINPAWSGLNYNSASGLRHRLGSDGSRSFQAGGNPQAAALRLDRLTPLGAGFTTDAYGPRNEPLVIIGSGSAWVDYSGEISLTVSQDPAGITLGVDANDARRLKALLEDGSNTLLITIGVYEWAPLQCFWTRPANEWPRDLPRVWLKRKPEASQRLALAGTVSGCPSGTLQTQPIDAMVRDEVGVLQAELALARARFGGSGGANATWFEGGTIDTATTYAPARFVGHIVTGDRQIRVMGPITRRSWNFLLGGGTRYTTERTRVDIEARP